MILKVFHVQVCLSIDEWLFHETFATIILITTSHPQDGNFLYNVHSRLGIGIRIEGLGSNTIMLGKGSTNFIFSFISVQFHGKGKLSRLKSANTVVSVGS